VAVSLNEVQCVYMRRLLFEELHAAARILVDQTDAVVNDAGALAGDDAYGTYVNRLQVTAELLDTVGWSTRGDTAAIVRLERDRMAS
jgi:hypothetical protein